jgi:hypothetical protein
MPIDNSTFVHPGAEGLAFYVEFFDDMNIAQIAEFDSRADRQKWIQDNAHHITVTKIPEFQKWIKTDASDCSDIPDFSNVDPFDLNGQMGGEEFQNGD